MFMLGTPRARDAKGASLAGKSDSGERLVVRQNWEVRRRKLERVEKTATGRIKFAKGNLAKLDELKAGGALDDEGGRVIATLERPPIVNFEIAVAAEAERGILKTALHFFASFVADVDRGVAAELLPYVLGEKTAAGRYVRTLPLEQAFFPESWPPRHEMRTYPVVVRANYYRRRCTVGAWRTNRTTRSLHATPRHTATSPYAVLFLGRRRAAVRLLAVRP
jgi:hypothetical protein